MGQMLEEDSMPMDLYQKTFFKKAKLRRIGPILRSSNIWIFDSDACSFF